MGPRLAYYPGMSLPQKLASIVTAITISCFGLTSHASPTLLHRPLKKTPIKRTELISVLRDSYAHRFGSTPSDNTLAMAWAQIALENATGTQVYGRNLGNVVRTERNQAYFVNTVDGHQYRWFDAFIDSAQVYWEVVSHCEPALLAFNTGDAATSANWLKRCGYFESDAESYVIGMRKWFTYAKEVVMPAEEQERQEKELDEAIRQVLADDAATELSYDTAGNN
jgi:hypothetical protein